ncbi:agamous-like MADS-box protein AP3 isoform X2 [Punica granatum]|uniref:Agamous-like MADS-box protein AP3 isoform X2 n=1 Tax=Punica granatum TaxID=22663 RepID=A0A6P8EFE8_PUNGR|nr:agamous-like MADS-box protein AP3 isoform X2 [Punica granatum]
MPPSHLWQPSSPFTFTLLPFFPTSHIALLLAKTPNPSHICRKGREERRSMARGKTKIQPIENMTNRQLTFASRLCGLRERAEELSVVFGAKVLMLMISSTNKFHEYISPDTSTEEMIDEYQRRRGLDLWSSHYEAMEDNLRKAKEENRDLYLEISKRRMGEGLNDMIEKELRDLEQEMQLALTAIRERKIEVISNQIETSKKLTRKAEEISRRFLQEYEAREDDSHYGVVSDGGIDPSFLIGCTSGGGHVSDHGPPPFPFNGDMPEMTTDLLFDINNLLDLLSSVNQSLVLN